jgi:ribonuclease P protein component
VSGRAATGPLPRHERLAGSGDFQAVFQQGNRIERASLVVLWRDNAKSRRVGFAVSRQIGGAVRRNRARRRLREAYRAARAMAPDAVDLVLVARRPVLTASFDTLARDVEIALRAVAERLARGRRP